ncbi:MAG: universal stress protein [Hyphomicrobium sp.]
MDRKILCATDGTPHSERAVQLASELASKTGSELVLCTVNLVRGGGRSPLIPMHEDAEIARILDSAAAVAKKAGVASSRKVALAGRDIAGSIVQYCENNHCDHVVTGTGDKHGVSRLVLGSVAAEVVSKAHCTVTVAR